MIKHKVLQKLMRELTDLKAMIKRFCYYALACCGFLSTGRPAGKTPLPTPVLLAVGVHRPLSSLQVFLPLICNHQAWSRKDSTHGKSGFLSTLPLTGVQLATMSCSSCPATGSLWHVGNLAHISADPAMTSQARPWSAEALVSALWKLRMKLCASEHDASCPRLVSSQMSIRAVRLLTWCNLISAVIHTNLEKITLPD